MSYQDRLKDISIEISGVTYNTFTVKNWNITHTLNNKVFTFSEFIEAYVNKLDSNGYNLSVVLSFSGINYDINAKLFRKALQSRSICKVMLPLGQDNFLFMHCVRISEDWGVVDSLGFCNFTVDFHTHNNKYSLPKTEKDFLDAITKFNDIIVEFNLLKQVPAKLLPQAIQNVKLASEQINSIISNELKTNATAVQKSLDIFSYIENLDVTASRNIDAFHNAFVELLSVPTKFNFDFVKNSRTFKSLSKIFNDLDFFNDEKHSFFYCNSHTLRESAMFFSDFAYNLKEQNTLPRSVVISERNDLNKSYIDFVKKAHKITAKSSVELLRGDWSFKTGINDLQNILARTIDNLEKIMLKSKVENFVYSNDFIEFYSFVNEVYDLNSFDEVEQKVQEIFAFNNFVGENRIGLRPETLIKYLV